MSFKRLDAQDFVVSADAVQSTAWSTDSPTLTQFFTSSVQMAGTSGDYYVSVFQTASTAAGAAIQFDVAYGNVKGSGSAYFNNSFPQFTPSSTNYGQYRTMILEDENLSFSYGDGTNLFSPDDFWVISVDRARYKESIFPGSFNLALSGSGGLLQLTDNSNDTSVQTFLGSSRVYQIVSWEFTVKALPKTIELIKVIGLVVLSGKSGDWFGSTSIDWLIADGFNNIVPNSGNNKPYEPLSVE